jgi:hypothetical protein
MGIRAVSLPPRPEPKATCPSCKRPIALLRTGKCIYCGANVPGALRLVTSETREALPVEEAMLQVQLQAAGKEKRNPWPVRIMAFGAASLLTAALIGPCMSK